VEALCDNAPSPYAGARENIQRVGESYSALRECLDPAEVELTVVDPRNTVWLLPAIRRDRRKRG
jgi:hypothetical protein